MHRRRFLAAATGLALLPATLRAHHGWHSFDQTLPIYLEGSVKSARWQNPHVELLLAVPADLKLPADLAARAVPAQSAPVDAAGILRRAALPKRAHGEWTIELAPLTRMRAWQVEEITAGERVSVVGYTLPEEDGRPTLRAEFLFRGARAFALRSSPA